MKTVKEVSTLSGVSIRTLRYYDEIGLLKPTALTKASYRMYDNKAIERLQQIMFLKELDIPLLEMKQILDSPEYDKEQFFKTQKSLLVKKRNRLNGIIELLDDVMKGANTMNFEVFNDADIEKIINHTLEHLSEEVLSEQIKIYGSLEKYREHLISGFKNEKAVADIIKWYGGKEKAMESILKPIEIKNDQKNHQNENIEIYKELMLAKETADTELCKASINRLSNLYKEMFQLDNSRSILLDLAKEYLEYEKLREATDNQFGEGCSIYVAHAIRSYYGEE